MHALAHANTLSSAKFSTMFLEAFSELRKKKASATIAFIFHILSFHHYLLLLQNTGSYTPAHGARDIPVASEHSSLFQSEDLALCHRLHAKFWSVLATQFLEPLKP